MHNPKGKTKTAMLLELESIKGLLVEEDGIPILQEVIGEDIPVLDVIVQPEDLPEETIPLLVSVVLDEDVAIANTVVESTVMESIAVGSEQPPLLQAQFATQDNYLNESESIELSLRIELPTEPAAIPAIESELEPAVEISSEAQAESFAALTSPPETSTWNEPDLLPEEIPTLLATTTELDIFAFAEKNAGELAREEAEDIGNKTGEETSEKTDEEIGKEIGEEVGKEIDEKTGEAAAASAQSATPQHRTEQQQDFFQIIEKDHSEPALSSEPSFSPAQASRPVPAKPAGENPFLPEHIRARLQSNNLLQGAATGDIHSKRFKALPLGSIHSPAQTANTPSPIQQQLINEVMDKMLPEIARELRARLEQMNKKMLEELLAEQK